MKRDIWNAVDEITRTYYDTKGVDIHTFQDVIKLKVMLNGDHAVVYDNGLSFAYVRDYAWAVLRCTDRNMPPVNHDYLMED